MYPQGEDLKSIHDQRQSNASIDTEQNEEDGGFITVKGRKNKNKQNDRSPRVTRGQEKKS